MNILKKVLRKNREIISYLIVGVLTTLVSLITYYICVFTILDPSQPFQLQMANIISWIVSVIFAFFTNRIFVFNSKSRNILKEAMNFTLSRVATLLMDMMIMFILVTLLQMDDKVVKLISQVVIIIANYILSKFLVFRKKSN